MFDLSFPKLTYDDEDARLNSSLRLYFEARIPRNNVTVPRAVKEILSFEKPSRNPKSKKNLGTPVTYLFVL
jgi:hypothetical protein